MTDSERRILDYSHCVEVVDQEESACFTRFPTGLTDEADRRGAGRSGPIRFFPGNLGEQIVEYRQERLKLFGDGRYAEQCPYCRIGLETVHQDNREISPVFGRIFVRVCTKCGWWESSDESSLEQGENNWYRSREVRRRALLREYSVGGSEVPLEALHQHIARHPHALSYTNPRHLEKLVGKAFSEAMDCEAIHIGGPNDDGIDLILVNGERQYVVQVKRRSAADAVESVQGIREFVGAMVLQGFVNGLYVTTAPRFSLRARRTARLAEDRRLVESIDLIDSSRLVDVCKLTNERQPPPWKRFASTRSDPPFDCGEESYFAFPVGG